MRAMQVKMFGGTGWELVEAPDEAPVVHAPGTAPDQALAITRRNEFDHARMTMSVVVSETASKQLHVFCKGYAAGCDAGSCPHRLPGIGLAPALPYLALPWMYTSQVLSQSA